MLSAMSLVALIKGRRGASGFGYASTAAEVTAGIDLHGKTILITGVATGLGLESARVLAERGAKIVGAARSLERAAAALRDLPGEHVPVACDLEEPASVRACASAINRDLDVILCNAGIMALPQRTLKHGQELQFLTNHLGHFILVTELLPRLTPSGRVVMLSSAAHQRAPAAGIQFSDLTLANNYSPWGAYGQSKLANLLFARALATRFSGTKRTANALHPGVIATPLWRHMNSAARALSALATIVAFKDVHQGAATQCYVAAHPAVAAVNGAYFADCNVAESSRHGRDAAMAERLWGESERIVRAL